MDTFAFLKLLDDTRVVEEIERYKWIESEKSGRDIGRERAALEWIRAYGHIWLKIHKPEGYKALKGNCQPQKNESACQELILKEG